jgi:hypothetical protein
MQVQAVGISLAGTVCAMSVFTAGKWALLRYQSDSAIPLLFVGEASAGPIRSKRPSINSIAMDAPPPAVD